MEWCRPPSAGLGVCRLPSPAAKPLTLPSLTPRSPPSWEWMSPSSTKSQEHPRVGCEHLAEEPALWLLLGRLEQEQKARAPAGVSDSSRDWLWGGSREAQLGLALREDSLEEEVKRALGLNSFDSSSTFACYAVRACISHCLFRIYLLLLKMWDLKLIFKVLSTVVIVAPFSIYHRPEALSRNILTITLPDSPILVTRKLRIGEQESHSCSETKPGPIVQALPWPPVPSSSPVVCKWWPSSGRVEARCTAG